MIVITLLFNFILIVCCLLPIYRNIKGNNTLCSNSAINLSLLIYYGIIPLMYLVFIRYNEKITINSNSYVGRLNNSNLDIITLNLALCILVVVLYNIVYTLVKKRRCNGINLIKFNKKHETEFFLFANLIFVLSTFSFILLIKSLGGIRIFLKYSEYARAFSLSSVNGVSSIVLFMKNFVGLLLACPFIYIFLYRNTNRRKYRIYFLISMIISCLYLIFYAGKLVMLIFFTSFIFDFLHNKRIKIHASKAIIIGILLLYLVPYLDNFFHSISYDSSVVNYSNYNYIYDIVNSLSFPFSNVLFSFDFINDGGMAFFSDCFNWIISIAPSRLISALGINEPIPIYTRLTRYYDSSSLLVGGSPVDLITFGIAQFHIMGVLVSTTTLALFSSKFDNKLQYIDLNNYFILILKSVTFWFLLIPYADPISNIRNRIDYLAIIGALLFFSKISSSELISKQNRLQ